MAIELATSAPTQSVIDLRMDRAAPSTAYTAIVIFDGERWESLCRELDIASEGDTRDQAFWNLRAAVRESLSVAAEKGVAAGQPVSDPDLIDFMRGHQTGPEDNLPVSTYSFIAD